MLSSLLRPKKTRRHVQEVYSPFSSPFIDRSSPAATRREQLPRHASADFTETEIEEDSEEEIALQNDGEDEDEGGDEDGLEEEDGDEDQPLLPIFSAAHLGIYDSLSSFEQRMLTFYQMRFQYITSLMPFDLLYSRGQKQH